MITVSIPTYATPPDLLDRAVRSALGQTGVDLRVVVVNDGGPKLDLPTDDRLTVYDLPVNRGRYFADAVVTRAIADRPDDWWAVLDADDWWEPGHLARLLPHAIDGAVVSTYIRHEVGRGAMRTEPSPRIAKRPGPRDGFAHLAHWCSGAWTVDRVMRAGGIHPGFRVGYDTQFVLMTWLTGEVGICRVPGYHWCRRSEGSLTTAKETRFGSPHRSRAKAQLVELYRDAHRWRDHDPGSRLRGSIAYEDRKEVERHALQLRRRLPR